MLFVRHLYMCVCVCVCACVCMCARVHAQTRSRLVCFVLKKQVHKQFNRKWGFTDSDMRHTEMYYSKDLLRQLSFSQTTAKKNTKEVR